MEWKIDVLISCWETRSFPCLRPIFHSDDSAGGGRGAGAGASGAWGSRAFGWLVTVAGSDWNSAIYFH